jgi:N-hydroxyarylamine O-acetyltransferase
VTRPAFDLEGLDLPRYLDRIGYDGPVEATLASLRGLHLAHVTTIPFENLDIQLGRPIYLDLASLQAKLVDGRRGGYCFEQNLLFGAVLETIGFDVTRLAARVRAGSTEVRPLTHTILRVAGEGFEPQLADVGFGGDGLLLPIPIEPGPGRTDFGVTHRLVQEDVATRVLQVQAPEGWLDLYAFTLEPRHFMDFVMGNHFTSTWPGSGFVTTLTVQRLGTEGTLVLRWRRLTETRGGQTSTRVIEDDDELLEILQERFGLRFPAGTRFPTLDGPDPIAS